MLKEIITSKAGFPFYTDYWKSYFCKMTGEQVKECLRIIFHFNETFEILESQDLAIEMVTTTIIQNIKRDAEKRTKQITANKNNGSKGGRPPKDSKPKIIKSSLPTLQEVSNYCQERKNSVNPQKWMDHYQSNGWKVGKNSMKDWKAAVRKWEQNSFESKGSSTQFLTPDQRRRQNNLNAFAEFVRQTNGDDNAE